MKQKLLYHPLATKVLAVCVANYKEDGTLFDWAVYVNQVPGVNHQIDAKEVAEFGDKQPKEIATSIFPQMDAERYRI